ncbi:MAG TPA: SdpI family protein [Bacteroidia bacterium]
MKKQIKEIALLALSILPLAYFYYHYNALPEQMATHFNFQGEADDYTHKNNFIWVILGINLGLYLLFLFLPKIDPRKRIEQMGEKYFSLRLMMSFFFTILMCYTIYVSLPGNSFNSNVLLSIIALLFAMFGNYFQTIRPNYFMGIRTPWTLESDDNWKITHRTAGRIWMIGGAALFVLSFVLSKGIYSLLFAVAIAIMVLYPIIQSYWIHRMSKQSK